MNSIVNNKGPKGASESHNPMNETAQYSVSVRNERPSHESAAARYIKTTTAYEHNTRAFPIHTGLLPNQSPTSQKLDGGESMATCPRWGTCRGDVKRSTVPQDLGPLSVVSSAWSVLARTGMLEKGEGGRPDT